MARGKRQVQALQTLFRKVLCVQISFESPAVTACIPVRSNGGDDKLLKRQVSPTALLDPQPSHVLQRIQECDTNQGIKEEEFITRPPVARAGQHPWLHPG